jgi:hypothetical protein
MPALQREQGAQAADDPTWVHRQAQAAAGFARTEATLVDASVKLRSTLVRSLTGAHLDFLMLPRLEPKLRALAARNGLPQDIVGPLSRLGLNAKARHGLLTAITGDRSHTPLPFPGFLKGCAGTGGGRTLASRLRSLASALAGD